MERAPYYFGRGCVYLTPPLTAAGGVSNTGYGGRAGTNWSDVPRAPGKLRMPPGRFAGNVRSMTISLEVDQLDVCDFLVTDENDYPSYIVRSASVALTPYQHSGENLADHLAARRVAAVGHYVSETVAASQATVRSQGIICVDHAIDLTKPVTVQPSWTDWTAGVHYQAEQYGLRLLQGYNGPVGATITIGYTKEGGAEELDALSLKTNEAGIVYIGTNIITGQPVRVDCYRVALQPGQTFEAISESINQLQIAGTLRAVRPDDVVRARWFRIMRGGLGG